MNNKTILLAIISGFMLIGFSSQADAVPGDLLLEIYNTTSESEEFFGWSVASTPDGNIIVGASNDNTGAAQTGSAYLFDGNTGNLLLTINNPTSGFDYEL